MKDQLESLMNEMVDEIKNIKDLTKSELPELVKEYTRFNVGMSVLGMTVSAVLFLSCIVVIVCTKSLDLDGPATLLGVATFLVYFIAVLLPVIFLVNLHSYFEYKLQPRRKAIEAITSLVRE